MNDLSLPQNPRTPAPKEWDSVTDFYLCYDSIDVVEELEYRMIEVGFQEVYLEIQKPECMCRIEEKELKEQCILSLWNVIPKGYSVREINFYSK